MRESRKSTRVFIRDGFLIMDDNTDSVLGQILDISAGGLRVACPRPVEELTFFRCCYPLAEKVEGKTEITFTARAVWCERDTTSDRYMVGLKLGRMSERNMAALTKLLKASTTSSPTPTTA